MKTIFAVLFAAACAAAPAFAQFAVQVEQGGDHPAAPTESPAAPSLCGCMKSYVCWGVAQTAFAQTFSAEKTEVDGALKGRFFPDALTFSLREVDKEGHFLSVQCGPKRRPCPSSRDALERRLMVSAFLSSVPLQGSLSNYFNPQTWMVTPSGLAALKEARACRPKFWNEIQALVKVRVQD